MKVGTLLVLVFCCLNSLSTQDFKGYILYNYKYTDSLGHDITDELGEKLGLEQHYFINGTDYVSFDHNNDLQQLYNSNDNKYYFLFRGEVKVVSADMEYPARPKITDSELKETILGHECRSFVFETPLHKTTYFYSDEVTIDPEVFSAHRFGNWATYLQSSKGALPLKIVIESEQHTQVLKATQIDAQDIAAAKFNAATYYEK